MHDIEYWLFDWDGCVADTLGSWAGSVSRVAEAFSLDLSDKQLKEQFRDLGSVRDHGLPEKHVKEYISRVRKLAMKSIFSAGISDGAEELFSSLRSDNKKLAIVTSAPKWVKDMVDSKNLGGYFDAIVTGGDVGEYRLKPHPYPIEMALRLMRGRKESAMMIGDSPSDIIAAERAGTRSARFVQKNGFNLYGDFDFADLKPDYTVSSFREMIRLSRPGLRSRIS